MASQFAMQPFYRSTPLTVDTHHAQQKYFEEEDKSGVLDDGVIEHNAVDSALDLSPPMANSRRESFAVGSTLFSPKTEDWQSVDMQSVPTNPFSDQNGGSNVNGAPNPFMQPHGQVFPQHGSQWAMGNNCGPDNSMQQFNNVSPAFSSANSVFQRPLQNHNPFHNTGNVFASLHQGDQSIPTSPQKEWMVPAQPMNKKMQPESPMIRSHNDMRRGDGIRKKNARFDIPAERNLSNIDSLISQSTDEQEIKELKQQKRLLRNRQAALDSRQRKKQHTERLEDEKKQYTALITDLEEEISTLKVKFDGLMQEKQDLVDFVEGLRIEKDDMIRAHTLETGELRKKVNVLTEHVQRLESQPLASSGTGANGGISDNFGMEGIGMPGAWDNPNFLSDYSADTLHVRPHVSLAPAKKNDSTATTLEGDKGASQGGLLFMLFLVGALVMSSRSMPAIPRVSEDVRAASATLLENVLKDAGINSGSAGMQAIAPQPSSASWAHPHVTGTGIADISMEGGVPSMLEELGDSLTQPTQDQLNEQIFSLSAAQYDGVSNQEFLQHAPERSTSQGRKNLADALTAMRAANRQGGAADVYTRSLLWDQIPSDVVRNFAKMVAESSHATNRNDYDMK
ncbi:Basic-leucine zipper (bZIP) transcription factor [Metarhizium album ARSEF 1941]|uniref:Basic-leucine zipper (BZIP) transcription factor n=1 Tax=Metarhizium album (strain ARSEF 1941) TaxID=1081103 RepID=A0A0B2X118_METAS|nr:Basic-leucine zipper (bZIP) transcription factor [Metarhizium album ARSEF 1941]KHO00024.1 Basic-leucine zipper (bZIP) transcription factor [Metarhizium album ARSEF 1941]